jgi:hypothetical protein
MCLVEVATSPCTARLSLLFLEVQLRSEEPPTLSNALWTLPVNVRDVQTTRISIQADRTTHVSSLA